MGENEEFTVRDRRRADADPAQEKPSGEGTTEQTPAGTGARNSGAEQASLPDVDFATFILSLATSAQISLGAIPHPETNETSTHIPAAKQIIDVIAMLQEKTKGNLTRDEQTLIEQVLFNLRMHFVRVSGEKKTGGS
jgi:hypothetical protein